MKRTLFGIVAAAAALAAAPAQASTNLITNGGFETGDVSGWTQSGNTDFTVPVCNDANFVMAGNCSVYFGPVGSIGSLSQTISTVAGHSYLFSFMLRNLGGAPNSFSASFDGNSVYSLADSGAFSALTQSFLVHATGTSTTVQFDFRHDPSFWGLDAVSVAGVPEPATWAMLILGFGVIGGAVRRRQRVTTRVSFG